MFSIQGDFLTVGIFVEVAVGSTVVLDVVSAHVDVGVVDPVMLSSSLVVNAAIALCVAVPSCASTVPVPFPTRILLSKDLLLRTARIGDTVALKTKYNPTLSQNIFKL